MNLDEAFTAAEIMLPSWLVEEAEWQGVFANSKKPHLRRLWRPLKNHRVNLHHFTACEPEEEFPHPHPWQMKVRILEGRYVIGLGRSSRVDQPPKLEYITLGPGDCYEMLDADQWHAIRPLGPEALTLMVAGPPIYPQNRIPANELDRKLTPAERLDLLLRVRKHYPG